MKCNICDKTLTPNEIKFDVEYDAFDPCGICLEAIADVFNDHLDEHQVTHQLEAEWGDYAIEPVDIERN